MAEYPKQYLTASSFTPAVFQPQVFTPKQEDISLLANSLNKLEEREEKLGAQKLAIAEAFSNARDLLPDNDETNRYITENQERITSTIDAMVNLGDMSGALDASKNLAAKFVSSPEFKARTEEHKQRNEWIEKLDKTSTPQFIKDYYKDTYSDKNNFTYDNNGNVNGTNGFHAPLPEAHVSATDVITKAIERTADERKDSASSHSASGSGSSSAYKEEKLTPEKLSNTAISIIDDNPAIKMSFIDQYNAGMHAITKLQTQLDNATDPVRKAEIQQQLDGYKSIFYKNGSAISSANDYINNLFSPDNKMITGASYLYKHSQSSSHTGGGNGPTGPTNPTYVVNPNAVSADDDDESFVGTRPSGGGKSSKAPAKGNRRGLQ